MEDAALQRSDDRPGADAYQLHAFWQPAYADRGGSWGRGSDNRRGDDGSWGRSSGDDDHDYDHDRDRRGRDDGGYGNGGYGNGSYGNGGYGGGYGGYRVGSGALHWSGRVDDVVDIRIQGGRVDYTTISGSPVSGVRSQLQIRF